MHMVLQVSPKVDLCNNAAVYNIEPIELASLLIL